MRINDECFVFASRINITSTIRTGNTEKLLVSEEYSASLKQSFTERRLMR